MKRKRIFSNNTFCHQNSIFLKKIFCYLKFIFFSFNIKQMFCKICLGNTRLKKDHLKFSTLKIQNFIFEWKIRVFFCFFYQIWERFFKKYIYILTQFFSPGWTVLFILTCYIKLNIEIDSWLIFTQFIKKSFFFSSKISIKTLGSGVKKK